MTGVIHVRRDLHIPHCITPSTMSVDLDAALKFAVSIAKEVRRGDTWADDRLAR